MSKAYEALLALEETDQYLEGSVYKKYLSPFNEILKKSLAQQALIELIKRVKL